MVLVLCSCRTQIHHRLDQTCVLFYFLFFKSLDMAFACWIGCSRAKASWNPSSSLAWLPFFLTNETFSPAPLVEEVGSAPTSSASLDHHHSPTTYTSTIEWIEGFNPSSSMTRLRVTRPLIRALEPFTLSASLSSRVVFAPSAPCASLPFARCCWSFHLERPTYEWPGGHCTPSGLRWLH